MAATATSSSSPGLQNLLCPTTRHILYAILEAASEYDGHLDAKFYHVCKDWRELLKEKLVTEYTFCHPDSNQKRAAEISTINDYLWHHCTFRDIRDAEIPALQYAFLIMSATFRDQISEPNFTTLLPKLSHVQRLILDQSTLFGIKKSALHCLNDLKQLEVLIITGQYVPHRDCKKFGENRNHNLNALRQILDTVTYENLVQLAVKRFWLPHSRHDGYLVESFWNCLVRHRKTLKHVTFSTRIIDDADEDNEVSERKRKLYMPRVRAKDLDGLQLISLFFGGPESDQLEGTQEIFKKIFETQAPKQLRHVHCNFSGIPNPISVKSLARSRKRANQYFNDQVVVVELGLSGDSNAEIDCEALFGHCEELRILTLAAGIARKTAKPVAQLLNIEKLPKSLQHFRVQRLHISQDDGDFIVWRLPNLRVLELVEIGQENGLGLDLGLFAALIDSRHIERLIFSQAFNRKSMDAYTSSMLAVGEAPGSIYSNSLDAHEKKYGYICMKVVSRGKSKQYTILDNANVDKAVCPHFPFQWSSPNMYRPHPSPDSENDGKPTVDWINNPYLQKGELSFQCPLASYDNDEEEEDTTTTPVESGEGEGEGSEEEKAESSEMSDEEDENEETKEILEGANELLGIIGSEVEEAGAKFLEFLGVSDKVVEDESNGTIEDDEEQEINAARAVIQEVPDGDYWVFREEMKNKQTAVIEAKVQAMREENAREDGILGSANGENGVLSYANNIDEFKKEDSGICNDELIEEGEEDNIFQSAVENYLAQSNGGTNSAASVGMDGMEVSGSIRKEDSGHPGELDSNGDNSCSNCAEKKLESEKMLAESGAGSGEETQESTDSYFS